MTEEIESKQDQETYPDKPLPKDKLKELYSSERYSVRSKRKRSLNGEIRSMHFKNSCTLQAICKKVADAEGLLYAEVLEHTELVLSEIINTMIQEGKEVRIERFGNFSFKCKKPRELYTPRSGRTFWTKAGVSLVFKPARIINEYFNEHGRPLYHVIKKNKEKIKEVKQQISLITQQECKDKGWHRELQYKNLNECSIEYLLALQRENKLQERLDKEEPEVQNQVLEKLRLYAEQRLDNLKEK